VAASMDDLDAALIETFAEVFGSALTPVS